MEHCAALQSLQPNTTSSYVDLAVSPNQLATFLQGQGMLLGLLTSPCAGELQSWGRMQLFVSSCSWYSICSLLQPECLFEFWHWWMWNRFFIVAETRFVLLWPVKDKNLFFSFFFHFRTFLKAPLIPYCELLIWCCLVNAGPPVNKCGFGGISSLKWVYACLEKNELITPRSKQQ